MKTISLLCIIVFSFVVHEADAQVAGGTNTTAGGTNNITGGNGGTNNLAGGNSGTGGAIGRMILRLRPSRMGRTPFFGSFANGWANSERELMNNKSLRNILYWSSRQSGGQLDGLYLPRTKNIYGGDLVRLSLPELLTLTKAARATNPATNNASGNNNTGGNAPGGNSPGN